MTCKVCKGTGYVETPTLASWSGTHGTQYVRHRCRCQDKPMMPDASGKRITGYQFGIYWFGISRDSNRPIRGLCGDGFSDERGLLASYDDTGQGVELHRVYEDGSQVKLRPKPRKDG